MMTSGADRLRVLLGWILSVAASLGLALATAYSLGLRINTSYSLPMGLYVTTSDTQSAFVEFCPSGESARLSKMRGYRSAGECSDGGAPLLKQIVAREGDIVEMSPLGISVNGKLLQNTAPLARDGAGRPLAPWKFGTYKVARGQVWVASTYNRGSYDSRYFGPIAVTSIGSRLKPLWTLHQ